MVFGRIGLAQLSRKSVDVRPAHPDGSTAAAAGQSNFSFVGQRAPTKDSGFIEVQGGGGLRIPPTSASCGARAAARTWSSLSWARDERLVAHD